MASKDLPYARCMPSSRATPGARRRPTRMSGEEREEAIVATLRRLLAERPLHALSVDDLARGAGISRPTFYFYFASKEAVLLTLLQRLVDEALAAQAEAPELLAADPVAAWRLALGSSYALWSANRDVIRAAAQARASDADVRALWSGLLEHFVARTAEAIEAERDRGAAPAGVPARDLALCLNRMNERLFEAALDEDALTLDADHAVDVLLDVWLRAIYGTVPGAP
jgi:TetR/AcrR family transcriptional regulator, ethionamide resistance regulator